MLSVYYMDVSSGCSGEQSLALSGLLPAERLERINRLKNAEMRRKRILTGAFLQYGLGRVLAVPMEKISYIYGDNGKPMLSENTLRYVKGQRIDFNLSHSGDYAVLAVSDAAVGIDIEQAGRSRLEVARRCFCEEEYRDIIAGRTLEEQKARFLQYWTCKEAYVKRNGEGMHIPFHSFRIKRQTKGLSYVKGKNIWFAGWHLEHDAYYLSLCSELRDELEILQESNPIDGGMFGVTLQDVLRTGKLEDIDNNI